MFSAPTPFAEALAYAQERGIVPTNASSAEIRQWERSIREGAYHSARTTLASYLQEIKNTVVDLLEGRINESTGRARLQDYLDLFGYDPAAGFGDDPSIPPAERGELRDLSSDRRIKLILDTEEAKAANFGYRRQGMDDLSRWQYPCWELVRVRAVKEERGDWARRWKQAGGQFVADGRMIARKDDLVWELLGSSALFADGLDLSYPPFAFNSGMGFREVERAECVRLGVIEADEVPAFQDAELDAGVKLDADKFDPEFLALLEEELRR